MSARSLESLPQILESSNVRIDPIVLWNVPDLWHARIANRMATQTKIDRYSGVLPLSDCLQHRPMAVYVAALSGPVADVLEVSCLCEAMRIAPSHVIAAAVAFDMALPTAAIVRLAKAGFADVFTVNDAVNFDALLHWIQANRPRTLYTQVWAAIAPYVEPHAVILVKASLRLAYAPYTVGELANACECSERSLRRLTFEAGLGSPIRLIALSRLIFAGFLLDRARSRIEWVSHFLEFESPAALRAKAKKWIRINSSDAADVGWIKSIGTELMMQP